jgi:hypothetical protein
VGSTVRGTEGVTAPPQKNDGFSRVMVHPAPPVVPTPVVGFSYLIPLIFDDRHFFWDENGPAYV